MSVGKKLHQLRKARNLTLKDLAKLLGIQYQGVQYYEKDRTSLRADQIIILSNFFGVKPSYFFDENPETSCLVYSNDHHADIIKQAKAVLESKTHYAKSLEMNVRSFYIAILDERSLYKRTTPINALYKENIATFRQVNDKTELKAAEPKKGYNDED